MTNISLEEKNESKYGNKNSDIISEAYKLGKREGDVYSIMNAQKYLRRFLSNSHKSNNPTDLLKAIDYIKRAYEQSDKKDLEIIE